MPRIWFRVGMEADITEEEMDVLLKCSGQKDGDINVNPYEMMKDIIKRGELSGETYIVGQNYGNVENYNNPEEEVNFIF